MDSFLMIVQPGGWRCEVGAGQSLLAAAEAAGVILPSSCRNGTCRTCLCRVVQGEVGYLIDWPGLSLDEKRAGDTLPCVALARSDVVLLAPSAWRADA
ncbi:2Fe-2S iron-sulfur cluster-binding protein [Massilia aquatica]|uniref:2Fe-2S iron-sulfur cluster binding domain-containing protein n=1 Tax=Massilia aquatica TaxID=2609000 RepID=A0ABX0MEQ8_9BURK|nr:2Fe-2S iron-sulfur cluster-binding protein [Massilia aquatica]NHZ43435.1 2Fe-2S iron-sulfur cluster binding domain-containing protein [Massilia aquatica]